MNKLLLFSVFSILTLNVMAQEKIVQTAGRNQLGTFAPKFAELNDDVLFGEVWNRTDKLGLRDRSLVTITSLISQGITDSSLIHHLQSAKKNGITRTEIAELSPTLASMPVGRKHGQHLILQKTYGLKTRPARMPKQPSNAK